MEEIHKALKETYRVPRVHAEMADKGIQAGPKPAERLIPTEDARSIRRCIFG